MSNVVDGLDTVVKKDFGITDDEEFAISCDKKLGPRATHIHDTLEAIFLSLETAPA